MISPASYRLWTADGERHIIIKPVNRAIPGGHMQSTGVFALIEGNVDLGDIVFDDKMNEWEYSAMGDLTHEQAKEIAAFIKNYRGPEAEGRELDEHTLT